MDVEVHHLRLPVAAARDGVVDAVLHRPDLPRGASVLLVPGAGGDLDSEPLVALAEVAAACGHLVVRANLVHHQDGRRAPRAESALPAYLEVLAAAAAQAGEADLWVLGGRSYGGRVASLAVADGTPAAGLLLSGYPLHPPGRPEQLRVAHWPNISVPCLFLQGDHDPFADLGLLRANRRKLPRRSDLVVVEGGDHALRVTGARSPDGVPRSPSASVRAIGGRVCAWLTER